jgi:CTP synthase
MQIAVIEFARNVCKLDGASSVELIILMPEPNKTTLGGTMRLGLCPTIFQEGCEWSRLRQLYSAKKEIHDRHRHRYKVNPAYIDRLANSGSDIIGKDNQGPRHENRDSRVEGSSIACAVQFYQESLNRVLDPSKPYLGFAVATADMLEVREGHGCYGDADNHLAASSSKSTSTKVNRSLSNGLNRVR